MLLMNDGAIAGLRRRMGGGLLDEDGPNAGPGPLGPRLDPGNLFKPLAIDPAPNPLAAPIAPSGQPQAPSPYMQTGTPGMMANIGHAVSGLLGQNTSPEQAVAPEVLSLLSSPERQSLKPGILTTIGNFLTTGETPAERMRNKATDFLAQKNDAYTVAERGNRAAAEAADQERMARFTAGVRQLDQNDPLLPQKTWSLALANGIVPPKDIPGGIKDMREPEKSPVPLGNGYFWNPHTKTVDFLGAKADPKDYDYWKLRDGNYVPVKRGEMPPVGAVPASTAQTQITVAGANQRAENSLTARRVKDFTGEIKPLQDRAAIIEQAMATIGDAANNPDPAVRRSLYSSAVANFVQAADQKAQLRYQMLQFFKNNVDPSIGGKWEVLKGRLLQGQLPQYTMNAMLEHLNNLKQLTGDEIETKRADLVRRHPSLDEELPDTQSYFSTGWQPRASGAAPATTAKPMSKAAYDNARKAGYTDAEIRAQGYRIPE